MKLNTNPCKYGHQCNPVLAAHNTHDGDARFHVWCIACEGRKYTHHETPEAAVQAWNTDNPAHVDIGHAYLRCVCGIVLSVDSDTVVCKDLRCPRFNVKYRVPRIAMVPI